MAATFKSGSLSAHSKSGASTSSGLSRLPAHASAYTFYMWKRALLVKGGKDYGLAEQMFQEPEAREVKPSFDPSKQPQAPTSLDALEAAFEDKLGPIEETISALKTEIKRHKSTLPDESSTFAYHAALLSLEDQLDSAASAKKILQEKFDRQIKLHSDRRATYMLEMKRHDDLATVHSKWCALARDNLDPLDLAAVKDVPKFETILDILYTRANSSNEVDMSIEWDQMWDTTKASYPINLPLWGELRERFFAINKGYTEALDRSLTLKFKKRLLEVIPTNDTEFTTLRMALHNDMLDCKLTSSVLLRDIERVEAARSRSRTEAKAKSASSMPKKRKSDQADSDSFCDYHQVDGHSTAECRTIKRMRDGNKPSSFNQKPPSTWSPSFPKETQKPLSKKGKQNSSAKPSAPVSSKPNGFKGNSKKAQLSSLTEMITKMAGEITSLKADKAATVGTVTSDKLRVLKMKGEEEYFFYSESLSDTDISTYPNYPTYLDCGSNRHITPEEAILKDVRPVSTPIYVYGATDTASKIQNVGALETVIGGNAARFYPIYQCDEIADTLISASQWLQNTEDRIVLTAENAFYVPQGTRNHHEIARVIDGMYHILPPTQLANNKVARGILSKVAQFITDSGDVTVESTHRSYSKPRLWFSKEVMEALTQPHTEVVDGMMVDDFSVSQNHFHALMLKTKSKPTNTPQPELSPLIARFHQRFAHFNLKSLMDTILKSGVVGLSEKDKINLKKEFEQLSKLSSSTLQYCPSCAQGKITQTPIYASDTPATRLLGIIHTDCIPLPCQSPQQERHGTIVVDGFTRWCEIHFHHSKSQSIDIVQNCIAAWEDLHQPLKVGAVRHDGGELKSRFHEYCLQHNPPIKDQPSPPYVKELNGLCERTYATHKGNAITMLLHAKLPSSLTKYALCYSVFVRNRMEHPEDNTTSPYKLWTERIPDISGFKPFGCSLTIYLAPEKRTGFYGERGTPGVFLGYHGETLIIAYNLKTRRIEHILHCIFHEDIFPGLIIPSLLVDENDNQEVHESFDELNQEETVASIPSGTDTLPLEGGTTTISTDSPSSNPVSVEDPLNSISLPSETDTGETVEKQAQQSVNENHQSIRVEITDELSITSSPDTIGLNLGDRETDDGVWERDFVIFPTTEDIEDETSQNSPFEEFDNFFNIKHSNVVTESLKEWNIKTVICPKLVTKGNHLKLQANVAETTSRADKPYDGPYGEPNPFPPEGSIKVKDLPPLPKSRKQAMASQFAHYWKEAEKAELNAIHKLGVGTKRKVPKGRKPLRAKWVYDYKIDKETNTLKRFKARLVARGDTQIYGIDFEETFSPVVKIQSIRIMMAIAIQHSMFVAQLDIDTAYLNADLDVINYMQMPEGYQEFDENGIPFTWELVKSLYGLHQSGREWYKCVSSHLLANGYNQAKTDPCVFYKDNRQNKRIFVLLYVDDMILVSTELSEIEKVKDALRQKFTIKDIGEAKHVLGMQLIQSPEYLYLGQPKYVDEILREADMWGCNSRPTPMSVNWQHDENSLSLNKMQIKRYRSLVMMLSYLAQQTRPDIIFAVNTLAQYQNDCRNHDWDALMHIIRYLSGTKDLGLTYTKTNSGVATLVTNDTKTLDDPLWIPQGYADASYAQEPGRKSRSGHVFFMGGAAVSWYCKKQPVVALSSTEAEYYALSEAVKESLWLRQLLAEIYIPLNDPTKIHQDNLSTMAIALNPVQHQRVKHMDVKVHFLRDHLDKQDIKLVYCPTKYMVADIFTKALPQKEHYMFTQLLGLRSLTTLHTQAHDVRL